MTKHIFLKVYISLPNQTLKDKRNCNRFWGSYIIFGFFCPTSASNVVIGQMIFTSDILNFRGAFHASTSGGEVPTLFIVTAILPAVLETLFQNC